MNRTNSTALFQSARRLLWQISALAVLVAAPSVAMGGIIVGTVDDGPPPANDNEAEVVALIEEYNDNNDPDLPTDIDLFGKTDDGGFPFDGSNGLTFWADFAMTDQVTSQAELEGLDLAYVVSTNPSLYYYSVKGGTLGFTLYTFMAGKNIMETPGGFDISHVSFWTAIPEPSSLVLFALGLAATGLRRRR